MNQWNPPAGPRKRAGYWFCLYQYFWVVVALWVVEIVDRVYFNQRLEWYGIHPRDWSHWQGILLAPLLHGGWDHLIGNSIPLLILGPAILIKGWENLVSASFFSALVAGVFVLIVGAQGSWHIGASSVVFGYFGFLVGMGYYERSPVSVIFALGVIIFYGGAVYTMFPTEFAKANHISWEGHLGGAVGGFWASKQRSKLGQRRR